MPKPTEKSGDCFLCRSARTQMRGIIRRLEICARTNQSEPRGEIGAHAVAAEQWRVAAILKHFVAECLS
jgi:hypothetical protein